MFYVEKTDIRGVIPEEALPHSYPILAHKEGGIPLIWVFLIFRAAACLLPGWLLLAVSLLADRC